MPKGRIVTEQDSTDFINGCLFMGTGGGGSPKEGMALLTGALADGLEIAWVDVEDVDDDAQTAQAFSMGSIAPATDETAELIADHGLDLSQARTHMVEAIQELGDHLGSPIACLVPAELGASNSPAPLVAAARLGIDVVDGDYAGRAIPDEMQTTPHIHNKPGTPFSSVDDWGNTAIVTKTANPLMLERVGKMLSIAGITGTTMAATPLPGAEMKAIVVQDTLSQCLAIGRAARLARETGDDPVAAIVDLVAGWRLFDGVVTRKDWEDRDGYMFGETMIEGTGKDQGRKLRVWFKNENHITWLDGEPWVCSPDLISIVDSATAIGFTNTDLAVGHVVSVVGVRGLDIFRTSDVLDAATGPRYFGFDIDYQPIESLLGGSR